MMILVNIKKRITHVKKIRQRNYGKFFINKNIWVLKYDETQTNILERLC